MKTISIIAPMYNEEKVCSLYVEQVISDLQPIEKDYHYEIVLVNDGSKDCTLTEMKRMQAQYPNYVAVVNLSRNFGLEGAIWAGLQVVKSDAVVVMDADLQDPPALILQLVEKWQEGYDVVVADRVKRAKDNLLKRATARMYYGLMKIVCLENCVWVMRLLIIACYHAVRLSS